MAESPADPRSAITVSKEAGPPLIDPELLPLIEMFPDVDLSLKSLPAFRESMKGSGVSGGASETCACVEHYCPGPEGAPKVRLLLYIPNNRQDPSPAYLHIHGGGFVAGAPEVNHADNLRLATRLGCVVASVDYRLAPETPYPGPLEDCYAALRWLYGGADWLGTDARRIAVGGESAGGGLAAMLAVLARDRGEIHLVSQVLIQPMLDDRTAGTRKTNSSVNHFMWSGASNRFAWRAFLGHAPGRRQIDRAGAAARVKDLRGLPPAFIAAAALDLFLEEDIDYARRLLRAGVQAELHVYPGAVHGFELMPNATATRTLRRDIERTLSRVFA